MSTQCASGGPGGVPVAARGADNAAGEDGEQQRAERHEHNLGVGKEDFGGVEERAEKAEAGHLGRGDDAVARLQPLQCVAVGRQKARVIVGHCRSPSA